MSAPLEMPARRLLQQTLLRLLQMSNDPFASLYLLDPYVLRSCVGSNLKRKFKLPLLDGCQFVVSSASQAILQQPSTDHFWSWTLTSPSEARLEVKKSKFLATAWPISSSAQALALVKEASDPTASHNCFAYKIGQEYRSSDDGEPSGTAGRPILAAIEAEQLDAVCVLVTRFFGGVKLGCGGLVRAYGGAARACLKDAPRCPLKCMATLEIQVSFASIGSVYQLLDKHSAERLSEDFPPDCGKVHLRVLVDAR